MSRPASRILEVVLACVAVGSFGYLILHALQPEALPDFGRAPSTYHFPTGPDVPTMTDGRLPTPSDHPVAPSTETPSRATEPAATMVPPPPTRGRPVASPEVPPASVAPALQAPTPPPPATTPLTAPTGLSKQAPIAPAGPTQQAVAMPSGSTKQAVNVPPGPPKQALTTPPGPPKQALTLPSRQTQQAPRAAASSAVAPGHAEFHVQAGAFKNREYANDLIRRLQASGYTATLAEGPLLRVYVGPATSRAAAERLVADLHSKGFEAMLKPAP